MAQTTLWSAFASVAERNADRTLLKRDGKDDLSYADVFDRARLFAQALHDAGARPGDRVSVQVEKSADALCLYLGCLSGGFVYHPLNPAYTVDERAYLLDSASPAVVVARPGDESIRGSTDSEAVIHTLGTDGTGTLADAADASRPAAPARRSADNLVALLYSSGTTGRPKGIPLTSENLLSNARALTALWAFSDDDVLIHALPFFHVHGLFISLGCALLSGASLRWLSGFDVDAVLAAFDTSTVMMGVPTYYTRLLANPRLDRSRCNAMRLFVSGSAPLSDTTFAEFERRTGHRILERYGMTETSVIASNTLDERRAGCVGRPLPGTELRIVDDVGAVCRAGEPGRIEVKGPGVFGGYWRDTDGVDDSFSPDGFFDTGDMGRQDTDGFVTIVGRGKDLIISGGMNVYPAEVEAVLQRQAGVREVAVVGVPDADFGEAVVACLVADDNVDVAALESLARRELANYKRPKRYVVMSALPRNAMGKVVKSELRSTLGD